MFYILVIFYLSFVALKCRKIRSTNHLLTLSNIIVLAFGIIFIFCPLLFETDLVDDHLFNLMMIACFYVLIKACGKIKSSPEHNQKYRFNNKIINPLWVVWGYFGWLIYRGLNSISQYGFDYFSRDRAAEVLSEEAYWQGKGLYAFMMMVITPLVYMVLLHTVKRSRFLFFLIYSTMLANVVLFAQHRTPIIVTLGLGLLIFHYYIRKVPITAIAFFVLTGLLILSFGAYYRKGITNVTLDQQLIKNGLRGFNTSEHFYRLYKLINNGRAPLEYGKNLYYYNVITFIPRRLWQGKPTVSFNARMTEKTFFIRIGEGKRSWVRTFTVWGEGFAQFHVIGALLYSWLIVISYSIFFNYLSKFEGAEVIAISYLLFIPLILRGAYDSVLIKMIVTAIALFLIKQVIYTKYKYPSNNKFFHLMLR